MQEAQKIEEIPQHQAKEISIFSSRKNDGDDKTGQAKRAKKSSPKKKDSLWGSVTVGEYLVKIDKSWVVKAGGYQEKDLFDGIQEYLENSTDKIDIKVDKNLTQVQMCNLMMERIIDYNRRLGYKILEESNFICFEQCISWGVGYHYWQISYQDIMDDLCKTPIDKLFIVNLIQRLDLVGCTTSGGYSNVLEWVTDSMDFRLEDVKCGLKEVLKGSEEGKKYLKHEGATRDEYIENAREQIQDGADIEESFFSCKDKRIRTKGAWSLKVFQLVRQRLTFPKEMVDSVYEFLEYHEKNKNHLYDYSHAFAEEAVYLATHEFFIITKNYSQSLELELNQLFSMTNDQDTRGIFYTGKFKCASYESDSDHKWLELLKNLFGSIHDALVDIQ